MQQTKKSFLSANNKSIAKHNRWINDNQNSKTVKLSKKALIKFATAAFIYTTGTISGSSLASTSPNSQLWLSSSLGYEYAENSDASLFPSNNTFPIFNYVSSRQIADDEQPNYTKAVVMALIRWMFAQRNEKDGNSSQINLQKWLSILIAMHKSGTPNKMAIFLAYVQNDILQEVDKSNNKALEMLEKAALAKQRKHDKEFKDRMELMQLARLRQVETSMQHYAALNDQAYQLGFETFKRLKEIDANLNTPIHQREAFKEGLEKGKHNYDLSAAERGVENSSKANESPINSDKDLIEADKSANNDEIKLDLSTVEN
ncbi:MAG: hypothetical protein ABJK37_18075 [Paraglaciecola sp.]|uniref:hypothetical protein n=1 Tax=Paraglaciecola sp. TaxID=1920173 RepID=UPI0032985A5F